MFISGEIKLSEEDVDAVLNYATKNNLHKLKWIVADQDAFYISSFTQSKQT